MGMWSTPVNATLIIFKWLHACTTWAGRGELATIRMSASLAL